MMEVRNIGKHVIKVNRYMKLTDARIPPSHPFRERGIPQLPRQSKSNLHRRKKTTGKQLVQLCPEASHEIKVDLQIIENHNKRNNEYKLKITEQTFGPTHGKINVMHITLDEREREKEIKIG